MQPFGYTGYQRDNIAGSYYAQAKEYQADAGRFLGIDRIVGVCSNPECFNGYIYQSKERWNLKFRECKIKCVSYR